MIKKTCSIRALVFRRGHIAVIGASRAQIQWWSRVSLNLHHIRRRGFLLACVPLLSCARRRASGFEGYAFVANEEGRSVAVVDLTAFAVKRHVALESPPTAVIAHPSRPAVYVLTPPAGTVHEIDAVSLSLKRKARAAATAHLMRLTPQGDALWMLCREQRTLARMGVERMEISVRVRLAAQPEDLDISREGHVAVSLPALDAVALLRDGRVEHTVKVGADPRALRFRSDGRQVLVGNRGDRTVSVVDVARGKIVAHLPLAVEPENFCFKPDGGVLFVTGKGLDAVAAIYPYRTLVAETLLAGRSPAAMAACSGPSDYLFVANPPSGDVTILDINTSKVAAVVAAGAEPGYITITPDNQYALVLNRRSGDMAVIRIAALRDKRSRPAPPPLFTMIRVGAKPVCAAVRAV